MKCNKESVVAKNDADVIYGYIVRINRENLNISQTSLAKEIGVSPVMMCNYETGKSSTSREIRDLLEERLGPIQNTYRLQEGKDGKLLRCKSDLNKVSQEPSVYDMFAASYSKKKHDSVDTIDLEAHKNAYIKELKDSCIRIQSRLESLVAKGFYELNDTGYEKIMSFLDFLLQDSSNIESCFYETNN